MSTKLSVIWSPCVDFRQGIADAVAILALNMSYSSCSQTSTWKVLEDSLPKLSPKDHMNSYILILISDIRIETTLHNEGQSTQASQHMPVMPS